MLFSNTTIMSMKRILLATSLLSLTFSQTLTLTGCHVHGNEEFCYLPNGSEVPFTRTGTVTATVATQTTAPATAEASPTSTVVPASVTGCHLHETTQFCMASGTEYQILQTPTVSPLPTEYTGCHAHETDVFCVASDGSEIEIALEGTSSGMESESEEPSSGGTNCHFHGNVEHCTGGSATTTCVSVQRDYDMGLRIGLIFVILAGSAFAVFSPMLLERFTKMSLNGIIFTILKQFGTGVIISTAFVHLLTHAELLFANDCLTGLIYEATTTAIAMAGVFLCFLAEYIGYRLIMRRQSAAGLTVDHERQSTESPKASTPTREIREAAPDTTLAALGHHHGAQAGPDNHFNVAVMESGIIFHSILIGITLNVTPDSYYITFFVVILFHQMFEGVALGTRIAALQQRTGTLTKALMALLFALITPVGMSIGAGVLHHFNGNDPSTIIALGTLNALSAGILLWVGLVEMLAHDWMHGDMAGAEVPKVLVGMGSLVVGMAIMSILGKWA